jgi:hypothetical protein
MGRITIPPTGPYAKWVAGYLDTSSRAFDLLKSVDVPVTIDYDSASRRVVYALSVNAEATSLAARLAVTYSLVMPAFALARVRLEQCIVASFLVHAPHEEGMSRYLQHLPIQAFEIARKFKQYFESDEDLSVLERVAADAQRRLAQEHFREGRFERTWSPLKLFEMAQRRDALALPESHIPWKLEAEYWQLYPLMSLAVHGASQTALWAREFHTPSLGSSDQYPYTLPSEARAIADAVARYDVI